MISVSHVTKRFGDRAAVSDLSFEVRSGEIVGFLGPNGAGKTTTMRMLTGALTADEGTIIVDDRSLQTHREEAQARIGYLPESNPLYKDMLVSDFLALSADLKRIPLAERAAALDFAVPATGIAEVYYRPISELSKGFKQRVGLAAAILHQPKVIILDEPTEGLDPNQRGDIRALIKSLAKSHTVLLSTHILAEAQAVCDRFLVIHRGKLVADGTADALTATTARTVSLEIEGVNVEAALKGMSGVTATSLSTEGTHTRGTLSLAVDAPAIQPALATLSHTQGWTIWQLAEQRPTLETVFHSLTQG